LRESRIRGPELVEFGAYMLINRATTAVLASRFASGYRLTLDDVEEYLRGS
jgi:hypothetical protein